MWAVTLWRGNHEECLFPQLCPLPVLSRIKQRAELCHLAVVCGERVTISVQAGAVFSGSRPVRRAVYNDWSQDMGTDMRIHLLLEGSPFRGGDPGHLSPSSVGTTA